MVIVDIVQFHFCLRVCKVKFLTYGVVLVNQLGSLDLHIQLIPIQLVGDGVPQMLELGHPWQWIPTQHQTWQISWLFKKCHQFGFALGRIRIC